MTTAGAPWTHELAQRLVSVGYREVPVELAGDPTVRAFRRSDFRVSWVFSRLHTFVIVRQTPSAQGRDVAGFSQASLRWAIDHKGGLLRGLQSGVIAYAVTVCDAADQSALDVAARRPDKHFAAFELPVLVHPASANAATYAGTISWGLVYQQFFGEQQRLIIGDMHGGTMPASAKSRSIGVLLAIVLPLILACLVVTVVWLSTSR
ncbi:MAG: hypothetical protein WKF72_02925 [Nocardioidaceae bacterium]